jgi:hypothetical protein
MQTDQLRDVCHVALLCTVNWMLWAGARCRPAPAFGWLRVGCHGYHMLIVV